MTKKPDIIRYRGGYKYQLAEDYEVQTPIVGYTISHSFLSLYNGGNLRIQEGYAWDGPSGPTFDTKSFMRGSLVHDALYQLMRGGLVHTRFRDRADRLLRDHCVEDGMWRLRARWVYRAVRLAAGPSALPRNRKKVYAAPAIKAAAVLAMLLLPGCATHMGGACDGWSSLKGDSSAYGLVLDGKGNVSMDADGIVTNVTVTEGELTICDRMGGTVSSEFMGGMLKLMPAMTEAMVKGAVEGASPLP